jgi:hypothetical protein
MVYLGGNSANLIIMNLASHERTARFLFWFAQVLGVLWISALLIFIGGTLIDEIIHKLIQFKEDFGVFILFFFELAIAAAFVISWYRKRQGPALIIALTVLLSIIWAREGYIFVLFHFPVFISGLLLLFYSYYKEWILKKKP